MGLSFSARNILFCSCFRQRTWSSLLSRFWRPLICSAVCLAMIAGSFSQTPSAGLSTSQAAGIADTHLAARVESILRGMTPEEKVGQLVQYSAGQPTGPGTGRSDYDDMIAQGQIGSLVN